MISVFEMIISVSLPFFVDLSFLRSFLSRSTCFFSLSPLSDCCLFSPSLLFPAPSSTSTLPHYHIVISPFLSVSLPSLVFSLSLRVLLFFIPTLFLCISVSSCLYCSCPVLSVSSHFPVCPRFLSRHSLSHTHTHKHVFPYAVLSSHRGLWWLGGLCSCQMSQQVTPH